MFARMWVSQTQRPAEIEAYLPMLDEGDLPHVLFYDVDANPVLIAQQVASVMQEHERKFVPNRWDGEDRAQWLVDNWPGKLEDGGITFPDGEFWKKKS